MLNKTIPIAHEPMGAKNSTILINFRPFDDTIHYPVQYKSGPNEPVCPRFPGALISLLIAVRWIQRPESANRAGLH